MGAELIAAVDGLLPEPVLERLAEWLRAGEMVALPTETVYGIGARADLPQAIETLRSLKGREESKHFTIHLPDRESLTAQVPTLHPFAARLMSRYWPGPLTLVLPDSEGRTTGYRVPAKELTREVLRRVGAPVVLSSANRSGGRPAATAAEVLSSFPEGLRAVVDAGPCALGEASTVIEIRPDGPRLLREGIISLEGARRAIGRSILFVCTGNTCRSPMAEGLMRDALEQRFGIAREPLQRFGFEISSAGLLAAATEPPTGQAVEAMKELGIDIAGHRSRPVREEDVERADCVVVMSQAHRTLALDLFPEAREKIRLLCAQDADVSDPFGGTIEEYRRCRDQMRQGIERLAAEV